MGKKISDYDKSKLKGAMTSLEIADFTGKKHRKVMRDIYKMFKVCGVKGDRFEGTYKDSKGEWQYYYKLDTQYTPILIMGYGIAVRYLVISRMSTLQEELAERFAVEFEKELREVLAAE